VLKIWECSMKGTGRIGVETVLSLAAEWLRSDGKAGDIRGTVRASG
jgi:DNA mismatch endonuclease (patch repair protein)